MRTLLTVILAIVAALGAGQALAGGPASSSGQLRVIFPSKVDGLSSVAVEFSLPGRAAAVDGRLLFDSEAAEVIGIAPKGGGTALTPQPVDGGVAFGAYGLNSKGKSRTTLRVIVAPHAAGKLAIRLVIDAAADANGNRITLGQRSALGKFKVGRGSHSWSAPSERQRPEPLRGASHVRDIVADGSLSKKDLDVVRAGWTLARLNGNTCGKDIDAAADANGDGCVDIVDIQAVVAAQGADAADDKSAAMVNGIDTRFTASVSGAADQVTASAAAPGHTFVVTSTADTPDANNGDGVCADSLGRCTFRAAITEANWQKGDDRIEFNLPGTAPVRIQYTSTPMSIVQDRSGGLVIDGYSQPGARVNTATYGSNAIPGVELRGTGSSPRGMGLYITSANNVIRGLIFNNFYNGVFVDTADAHDNTIVGNWFAFTGSGNTDSYNPHASIILNTGSHHNIVGSPALADRNVTRGTKAIYFYGPRTDNNVVQNNLLCQTPSGNSTASCSTGIDTDFGPDNNLIGGAGAREGNVIGRTTLNGIEYSHGWDPKGSGDAVWQNNNNRAVGNWVGFRADGHYDPSFRVAQNNPGSADNGNGFNVYDGSNFNIIEGNWISSVYDGMQTMSPNSTGNIFRNNIIGESPRGEAAPIGRYGILVRGSTKTHTIEGNIIRNAGVYGIALTQPSVLWIRLSQNIISDMSGPAFYFAPYPDGSGGADNLIPAPTITSATTSLVVGNGIAGGTVEVYRASRQAGSVGLPVEYLGSATIAANGSWTVGVNLSTGDRVTALQIHPSGNTSNLASNASVSFAPPPAAPNAAFTWSQESGTYKVDFKDASTGAPSSWSWSFGDGGTSNEQNPTHTYASAGDYTVTLTAGNAGGNDSTNLTVSVAEPPPPDTIAADSFGRTLDNRWGSADVGGPYDLSANSNNYDVGNGIGTIEMPKAGVTRSALLDSASARDVDITFRVAADKKANGGRFFVYAVARRNGNSEYRPRLIFNADGSLAVNASVLANGAESALGAAVTVPGVSQQAGAFIWVRAQVSGANPTTVRVKAWADGSSQPSGWLFTATDGQAGLQSAGSLGLRVYLAGGVSNAPVTFSFDDYLTTAAPLPPPSSTVVSDTFERTLSDRWGSADTGGSYSLSANSNNYDVNNGVGTIEMPKSGVTRSALLDSASARDVDITFKVAVDKVAAGGRYFVYAVARRNGNSEYRPRVIFEADGSIAVNASVLVDGSESSLGGAVTVPGLTQSADSFIWFRAQVTGASPTTVKVKAWAAGTSEPAGWNFTATSSQSGLQTAGSLGLRAYLAGGVSNAPVTFSFDNYTVGN